MMACIGIAVYPLDNVEIDELIKNADSAMYRAKEDGKNSFEFYTKEMNSRTLERMTMENELRHESMLMKNPESAIKALQEIKAMGVVRINIDDFGTGYSSLSYLKHFPISTVKIDLSFVHGIPDDDEDIAITRAVIAMAHSLKLNVIAEGVENIKQHAFLLKEKCDEIQGYFFSKPLPAAEFTQLLLGHQIVENRKLWQHR